MPPFNFTTTSALADVVTGLDLLSLLGTNVDIVGLYSDGAQVFSKARPMKASPRETSKIMEHPVETGVMLADHHIINPIDIDLPLIVPSQYYVQTYQEIKQAFVAATKLSLKTPVTVYNDLIIADMPHDEDPDMFGVIVIGLHLRQVLYALPNSVSQGPQNYAPAAAANQNTVQSGLQSAAALGTKALTTATSIASYATLAQRLK